MNNVTPLLAAIFAIQLGGCAYQPKQVEASRPLVNPVDMNAQPVMPSAVQQALNTLPQGSAFTHHDTTVTLGKRYVSALGRECVELIYSQQQGHQQRSAACKSAEQWYQVPQLDQASLGNLFAR
ncbi:hypothetical protein ACEUBW_00780 [Aeromonas veronii]|uniref:hypothetical protein n=1 Tax=Aeromonas veronii TaxID=654 RepID=UPI0038E94E72